MFDECTIFCASQSRRKIFTIWYALSGLLTCSLRHLLDFVFMRFPQGSTWGLLGALKWAHMTVCQTGVVAFFYVGCLLGRFKPRFLCVFVHICRAKHQEIVTPMQLRRRGLCDGFFTENVFVMNFRPTEVDKKSKHFRAQVCMADVTSLLTGIPVSWNGTVVQAVHVSGQLGFGHHTVTPAYEDGSFSYYWCLFKAFFAKWSEQL